MDGDIKVIKRVLRGDIECFEELVQKYEAKIYRTCYKFVKNEQDAKDVAQEVFIKIYNNLASYKQHSKFSTWAYKIAVNSCLNFLRKKDLLVISFNDEANPDLHKVYAAGEYNAQQYYNPERVIVGKEIKDLLESELDSLDNKSRRISDYRINHRMPFNKIAEKIGVTASAARMSFFRTKKKLAKRLNQYHKEE